jgi:hypothetical protein
MPLVVVLILAFLNCIPFYCASTGSDIEIVSSNTGRIINGVWTPNYYFFHNDDMWVQVIAKNKAQIQETTTVYVSAFDDANYPIGFSEADATFSAGETKTVYFSIHIPTWARLGTRCRMTASTPSTIGIAISFTLLYGTPSLLTLQTFVMNKHMQNMTIWFNGYCYPSPMTIPLVPGTYSVKAESTEGRFENGRLYLYRFSCWEDGSTSNLRTIDVNENSSITLTANYVKYRPIWQPT